jgi:hypothetical protein
MFLAHVRIVPKRGLIVIGKMIDLVLHKAGSPGELRLHICGESYSKCGSLIMK